MTPYIVLHDRRLFGGIPARSGVLIIKTSENTSLRDAFQKIDAATRDRKAKALFLVCHGGAGENKRARISLDAGGYGIAVGREALKHHNVSMWTAIRNRVENIVV